jgi:GABA(A) receptor-associated protein
MSGYRELHTFASRKADSDKIKAKFPDRIPIVVELAAKANLPPIDKCKFLVPADMNLTQFLYVLRQRIKVKPEQAIFIFIANKLPAMTSTIGELNAEFMDPDGFLYMTISGENSFGI